MKSRTAKFHRAAIQNPIPARREKIQNPPDLTRLAPALERLAEALLLSRVRGEDPWDRALTLAALAPLGLTLDDCRALLADGLIETDSSKFKFPSSKLKDDRTQTSIRNGWGRRSKSPSPSGPSGRGLGEGKSKLTAYRFPHLGPRTPLLLTDLGLAKLTATLQKSIAATPPPVSASPSPRVAASPLSPSPSLPLSTSELPAPPLSPSQTLPSYDIDSRQLSVAGEVILRLPVQARNLAAVLTAIELSGWKLRVCKPLNGRPGGNDPHHLANAALALNEHQTLIDFQTDDGTISWAWRLPATRRPRTHSKRRNGAPHDTR